MKRLFSVFDKKARAYGPLMSYGHEANAVRDFSQAVLDPQTQLGKYPEDFELHEVGAFDDQVLGDLENALLVFGGSVPRVVLGAQAVLAVSARGPQLQKEA